MACIHRIIALARFRRAARDRRRIRDLRNRHRPILRRPTLRRCSNAFPCGLCLPDIATKLSSPTCTFEYKSSLVRDAVRNPLLLADLKNPDFNVDGVFDEIIRRAEKMIRRAKKIIRRAEE